MKILSIHVQAFGKLSGVNLKLKDGVNVIQNVNGFGKTTLASFIRAMLYGFTYKTVGGVKDAARFAPWQGVGRFGGSMTVEHDGQTYRIERFFGATQKQETLTVLNEKTGKPLELNGVQVGEYFLGLTADSYDRSAYFPQEAVELSSNDNFDSRLANLIENGADDFDKIQEKLRAYKKSLRYEKGNGGKIYELDCKRRDLLQKQGDGVRARRRVKEIDSELLEIEAQKQTLSKRLNEQIGGTKEQTQQLLAKGYNKLLLYMGLALSAVGIVFLALGLGGVLGDAAYKISAPCLGSGIVGVVTHLILRKYLKRRATAATTPQDNTVEQLNTLSVRYGQLTEERKSLAYNSVEIEDERLTVDNQRAEAQFDYEVADTVSRLLTEAKDNLSSGYIPKLTARCSELLSQLTDANYSVIVDRSFNVKIREQGQTRDMSEFSRGIREVTLLCFRVALSELLYDKQIPFIIIDDAFVNFDEYNFKRATHLLKQLAAHGQVVYFTCHDRTGELLK